MMHAPALVALAFLALVLSHAGVRSQPSEGSAKPGKPAGETVRYTILDDVLMNDQPSDAIWREARRDGKLVSAQLDVCYSVSPLSNRKDRFVVKLRPKVGRLVGTGRSEPGGTPVAVNLVRKQKGETFALTGKIIRGSAAEKVETAELPSMSEAEFREQRAREEEIVPAPKDFTVVTPITLGVRVVTGDLVDVVKALRGLNVRVDYASLVPNCSDLRAGRQLVRLEADPARAPAIIAKVKALAGVRMAGWTPSDYGIERAVRIKAGPWRDTDKIKTDQLGERLSGILAAALGAKGSSTERDKITQELTLEFKRPDAGVPGLDLTELVELDILVGPDKPGGKDHLIIWISEPSVETVDEGAGPRLAITNGGRASDEHDAAVDLESLLTALAKALKGRRWDPEKAAWK